MAFTTPSTWVAGNVLTAAQLNTQLRDNMRFFHGPPTARVTRAAVQSITNAAWNAISFDTEDWDSDTIWSSTAPTKVFCRTAGKYQVNISGGFANSSAGTLRYIALQKNTTVAGNAHEFESGVASTAINTRSQGLVGSQLISLTAGQFVRLEAFQDSGGSLNTSTSITGGGPPPMRLSLLWVSS